MDELKNNVDMDKWFSTYGTITAERILARYQIVIPPEYLVDAIKNPLSFYHYLLQIPLKNVLNGIILQQASDYHVYAQKLFIDYLLSGETGKPETSQGALTRESLEEERQALTTLGENFHKLELEQNTLIGKSQASLIKTVKEWQNALEKGINQVNATLKAHNKETKKSVIRSGLHNALINCALLKDPSQNNKYHFIEKFNDVAKATLTEAEREEMVNNLSALLEVVLTVHDRFDDFSGQISEMNEQALSYRKQFYDTILRVTELMHLLPEYKIDPAQDAINRESLHFDRTIGDH